MNDPAEKSQPIGCLTACVLAGFAALLLTCFWDFVPVGRRPPTYHLGAVAVLEGPEELWVFAEVDEREWRRGWLASPPYTVRTVAQYFVAVAPDGIRTRKAVRLGPTFHPNLNRFVWHAGDLYLADATAASFRRWDGSGFATIPLEENRRLSAELGLDGLSVPERFDRLGEASSSGKRRVVAHERHPMDLDVEPKELALRVTGETSAGVDRIWAKRVGIEGWQALVIEITASEFRRVGQAKR